MLRAPVSDIFVSGAGGFVARNLRAALAAAGFHLVSASRSAQDAAAGEIMVRTSDYTEDHIMRYVSGCHTAFHLVGSGIQSPGMPYQNANHAITGSIVRICRKAGVRRIVYLSGLGVSERSTLGYFVSKHMAESEILRSGLEYTILRPSYIIGRDDYLSQELERQIKTGAVIVPGSGRYLMQPVSIRDTVNILATTAGGALQNMTLDLVGPQAVSFAKFARMFAGGRASLCHTDMEEEYRRAILGEDAPYNIDDLCIMTAGYTGDHDSLRRATGIQFQSIPQMLLARSSP